MQSQGFYQTASSSSIHAGKDINLAATGKTNEAGDKQGGHITIRGSEVSAGQNATLIANDKINILAAKNTQTHYSKEKSSSGSIGVGVAIGQQTGFGIDIGASGSKATDLELSHSWSGSKVSSGQTTTLISGGDTNIIGSQVKGNKVIADIGGDLNIESLQDVSYGHSDSKTTGGSISIGVGSYTSISGSQDKSKADGYYASVNEYAGIFAGDQGFDVTVKGNTDLKGALIASTQEAIDNNKNSLTTGTLTTDHILNINTHESEGSSISGGLSFNKDGSKWDTTPKVSPTIPLKGDEENKELSWTLSGISGGEITITDEEGQKQKTGQTAQEAIDSINTDVTIHTPVNSLTKDWDTQELVDEMNANLEIGKSLNQELNTFKTQQAKKRDELQKELDGIADKESPRYKEVEAQLKAAEFWAPGGKGLLVLTAVTGAISGNVSGSSSDLLQGSIVNAIQGLGATQIKNLMKHYEGENKEEIRGMLHAIWACGGAAAQGGDCGSAALGAGGAVVLNNILDQYLKSQGKDPKDMSQEEKRDRQNLVEAIIVGVTEAVGGDSNMADLAAKIEMENNYLTDGQKAQRKKELAACDGGWICEQQVKAAWELTSSVQDAKFGAGFLIGGAYAGGEFIDATLAIIEDPQGTIDAVRQIIASSEAREQLTDVYIAHLEGLINDIDKFSRDSSSTGPIDYGAASSRLAVEIVGVLALVKGGAQLAAKLPSAVEKGVAKAVNSAKAKEIAKIQVEATANKGGTTGGSHTAGSKAPDLKTGSGEGFFKPSAVEPYQPAKPIYGQGEVASCAAGACRMAADLGDIPEAYIRGEIGTALDGTALSKMPEGLRNLGFEGKATYTNKIDLSSISNASKNGEAVIVNIKSGDQVHAIVIDSVQGGRAYIRDPWPQGIGSSYSVPLKELEELLSGSAVIIKP